jgi:glutamate-1-semialdehyde aminotransferase
MQKRAAELIPGKTQLLSKRPEMFAPGQWPGYYSRAKGSVIWDLDENPYFDFSIGGIGANILGYADEDVDGEVKRAINLGTSSSLNCPEEVELAEYLNAKFPWFEMFRYTRSGGEAMAVAARISRASSKKDLILFCGYHGWHDWYLSTNIKDPTNLDQHLLSGLSPRGVPESLAGTSIPFIYNDIEMLESLFAQHKGRVAAVIMEPRHDVEPIDGFLGKVRQLCDENKAILVFDEITSAFRESAGPIHEIYGVYPDIAVFSKAISNGYPMGIVCGASHVMQSAQETFISSTSWTERIGPIATLATLKKYQENKVHLVICAIGDMVRSGWEKHSTSAGIELEIRGLRPLLNFNFLHPDNLVLRTLFVQKMLERGFLASNRFYAMYTHDEEMTRKYLCAVEEVFLEISRLLESGRHTSALRGPIAHSGFQRLN